MNIDSLGLGSAGDTYTVGTTFSWTGNNLTPTISGGGTGILDIPVGSLFDITTYRSGVTQFAPLDNLVVNNAGTINLNPVEGGDSLQLTNNTMINNSGTFTLQGFEIDITGDDTGAINNTGLFQKTGSGTSIVNNVDFNSTTATISEVAGTLQFQDGGLWTGNHTLIGTSDLTGGTFNITDGSIFTGDLRIDGATVNLQGDFEIDTLDLETGALNIDSLGLVSAGNTYTVGTTFSWSGNNTTASPISGGGTGILDIPVGSLFDITTWRFGATQFAPLDNLVVNNAGTINLNPGGAMTPCH